MGEVSETKLLGLQWKFSTDNLTYHSNNNINTDKITKRSILSNISKTFDPLGLLAPSITLIKILIQDLWSLKLDWDEDVPNYVKTKWLSFKSNLSTINDINIPRHVLAKNVTKIELHGFCDASQQAYGACIYARCINNQNQISVNLFCAKGKVSPLKTLSIPRLELCGALILSKLMNKLITSISLKVECFFWTDSQVVLAWIQNQSRLFHVFVANRISEIQNLTNLKQWNHVSTRENPADLISRGIQPHELRDSNLWWKGPTWLSLTKDSWPNQNIILLSGSEIPELKNQISTLLVKHNEINIISKFSSLTKLKRTIAYCFRFSHNCQQKLKQNRKSGLLSVSELNNAFNSIIKMSQTASYYNEIKTIQVDKQLPSKQKLTIFNPYCDSQGILRVGGRIQNTSVSDQKYHPIILDSKCHLSTLILTYEHLRNYHAGPQHLLYISRQKFWIIGGRSLSKRIVHKCIACFKAKPKSNHPMMGILPSSRTQITYPFLKTGTDFAGPFIVRTKKGRGQKTFKCYICLFVCMCTKAIHLEVVTDLTTDSFLLILRRFIARRGQPTDIFSDNGRTFVKASSELRELGKFLLSNQNELHDLATNRGINWHFIPAYAPNFGGLWEAGVKSTKHHLKRVLANALVTLEEFITISTEIEGILNSRPIYPLSSDPGDLQPLSPGHFLIGRSMTQIIESDLTNNPVNRLSNYQRITQLKKHFWTRWYKEYISELQLRYKWKTNIVNNEVGSLVLIKDNHLPPACWKLGRIIELHPGKDNIVRVVSVKTTTNVIKRAVSQVCVLPLND